ncbi:MAG: baseplate J/gp47 family protein [Acidobacteriota bacterium]
MRRRRSESFLRRAGLAGPAGKLVEPRPDGEGIPVVQTPRWYALLRVEVSKASQRLLELGLVFRVEAGAPPLELSMGNLLLLTVKGERTPELELVSVGLTEVEDDEQHVVVPVTVRDLRAAEELLVQGDPPSWVVQVVDLMGLEANRSRAGFLTVVNWPEGEDCPQPESFEIPDRSTPELDYLARDYSALRQVMLDQLSLVQTERSDTPDLGPADEMTMLVEVLAYAADKLSYYQDAAATEAYLETARRRLSVRRHARLVDYRLHEGCNSRLWASFEAEGTFVLPGLTPLLTGAQGFSDSVLAPSDTRSFERALAAGAEVFLTLEDVTLSRTFNELSLADPWGRVPYALDIGTTEAFLVGHGLGLEVGMVLILEEVLGVLTGSPEDADPERRAALRLQQVDEVNDVGNGADYTRIRWFDDDALLQSLAVVALVEGREVKDVTVVRANVVAADHGRPIPQEVLQPSPVPAPTLAELQGDGRGWQPVLQYPDVTFAVPWDGEEEKLRPARATLEQDPDRARPSVHLVQVGEDARWHGRADLLSSGPYDRAFVLEVESDRGAMLRFGDDSVGRRPPPRAVFEASYRVGNGTAGNVGADALATVVTTQRVNAVTNLLPATGGVDPELLSRARLNAPDAYGVQQRGVTEEDYRQLVEALPTVQQAAVVAEWSGSWLNFEISIDRLGGLPLDDAFLASTTRYLEAFRLAGTSFSLRSPRWAAVEIQLVVYCSAALSATSLRAELDRLFGTGKLADGSLAYFHPDRFTFGQSVVLSDLVEQAQRVTGVDWVNADPQTDPRIRFRRWGQPSQGELTAGEIPVGPLEIVRADSNPAEPTHGSARMLVVQEA